MSGQPSANNNPPATPSTPSNPSTAANTTPIAVNSASAASATPANLQNPTPPATAVHATIQNPQPQANTATVTHQQAAEALAYAIQNPGQCPPSPWSTVYGAHPQNIPTNWIINTLAVQAQRKRNALAAGIQLPHRYADGTILKEFEADSFAGWPAQLGWEYPLEKLSDGIYDMYFQVVCMVGGRVWWASAPPKGYR